jgi:hypothetical protein
VNSPSPYTKKGTKDARGVLVEDTSLKKLMNKQQDFLSDLTLLQYHAAKLDTIVDHTLKCHPELAGEGIEYVWVLAKLFYHSQAIALKRSKDKFRALVQRCTSSTEVVTISQVQKCSIQAREYMLAYKAIDEILKEQNDNENMNTDTTHHQIQQASSFNYKLIEKSIKTYKTHRNALDTDTKWIRKLLQDMGEEEMKLVKLARRWIQ